MIKSNQLQGKLGENIACKFLLSKGDRIISRNFHCSFGEIDIITQRKNILVFVEVKTRVGYEYGLPQEAVTKWKLQSISKTGEYFKTLHPKFPECLQIDVIAITLDENNKLAKLEHLENVTG